MIRLALALAVLTLGLAEAPVDAVTVLQKKIDAGQVKLTYDAKHGYLSSVLKNLDVPVSSQTLVFAKNSFELFLISPEAPRAIYFNDDTYVSWTRGAPEVEVAATDPKQGPAFYTLSQEQTARPKFKLESEVNCLVCHDFEISSVPLPRLLMLSVMPTREGTAIGGTSLITNDQSPLRERWGGWYVTGTSGNQQHLGNKVFPQPASTKIDIKDYAAHSDLSEGTNETDLSKSLNTAPFLTSTSDIVALMILGHQTHVHNLITLAGHTQTTETAESLVKAMLFSGAAPFTDPIKGTSPFAEEFQKRGPRDSKGRSLRDLDLQHRLFRYPLSYLIYSPSFDTLPKTTKDYVYRRFHEILSGQDRSKEFEHLSGVDRAAILQILTETKPDF
jgi:hypothetical protein